MGDSIYEIFFLNPKSYMILQIRKCIIQNDFKEVKSGEKDYIWKYKKENMSIYLESCADYVGPYIIMVCEGIPKESLRERMLVCPECASDNLQIKIMYGWRNTVTEQLSKKGKLNYGPAAYDRRGTLQETHKCLNCGCKWHNGATLKYWNEIIKQGRELTKEDLGI